MIRYQDLLSDTICSPITPQGYSGVGVIRISGEKSFELTLQLMGQNKVPASHLAQLAFLKDEKGQTIDQVLVTFFEKGRSFTGDPSVEISCHGNPLIINTIVRYYLDHGCRSAEKGEFSFRAYYNGKIDLVQAESIQSLVTSNMRQGSNQFLEQLQGRLSKVFDELENTIVTALAHLEASIDFTEEDIETADFAAVETLVQQTIEQLQPLLSSYDVGKVLQDDLKILILGKTNAGKSSLFNRCIEAERAIVTEVEGTTRDLVTEKRFLGNNSVQFIDSAGLRETSDVVEKIGIQKSLDQVDEADLILAVIDLDNPGDLSHFVNTPVSKIYFVFNKMDLVTSEVDQEKVKNTVFAELGITTSETPFSFVSSKTGEGVKDLLLRIEKKVLSHLGDVAGEAVVTQARHFNHLEKLSGHLVQTLSLIEDQESPDLVSQELQMGLLEIHQLLGKEYDDEVLDKIFSSFCIGK